MSVADHITQDKRIPEVKISRSVQTLFIQIVYTLKSGYDCITFPM